MLTSETVVIDFEGFRYSNQPFILKEVSVRGLDYYDSILLKPPFPINLHSIKAQKSYKWTTENLHGILWDSGTYDYSFIFCFFTSLKIRFPNIIVYAKGHEKCSFLRNFFSQVNDLDQLNCPKASDFPHIITPTCFNHLPNSPQYHCARNKTSIFYNWLSHYQQNPNVFFSNAEREGQLSTYPVPEFNHFNNSHQPNNNQNQL